MKFDSLELQKNIEEKRLFYGQKLEKFLLNKLEIALRFLLQLTRDFFAKKFSTFIACLALILLAFCHNHNSQNILFAEIFNYLLGAISIYFCNEILRPHQLRQVATISFCAAYFFRINFTSINEISDVNYILALLFPYLSSLCLKDNQIISSINSILAVLIICVNPYFALLVAAIEIINFKNNHKFWQKNATTFIFVMAFYFLTKPQISLPNVGLEDYIIFKELFFPYAFFSIICFDLIKKNNFLNNFIPAIIAIAIITILENKNLAEIFFAVNFAFLILILFLIFKKNEISWKKNWPFVLLPLVLPHFDADKIFSVMIDACLLWWLILILQKKINWPLFFLAFVSIGTTSFDAGQKFSWLFCAIMLIVTFKFYIKKYYDKSALALLSFILSYIIYLL